MEQQSLGNFSRDFSLVKQKPLWQPLGRAGPLDLLLSKSLGVVGRSQGGRAEDPLSQTGGGHLSMGGGCMLMALEHRGSKRKGGCAVPPSSLSP